MLTLTFRDGEYEKATTVIGQIMEVGGSSPSCLLCPHKLPVCGLCVLEYRSMHARLQDCTCVDDAVWIYCRVNLCARLSRVQNLRNLPSSATSSTAGSQAVPPTNTQASKAAKAKATGTVAQVSTCAQRRLCVCASVCKCVCACHALLRSRLIWPLCMCDY